MWLTGCAPSTAGVSAAAGSLTRSRLVPVPASRVACARGPLPGAPSSCAVERAVVRRWDRTEVVLATKGDAVGSGPGDRRENSAGVSVRTSGIVFSSFRILVVVSLPPKPGKDDSCMSQPSLQWLPEGRELRWSQTTDWLRVPSSSPVDPALDATPSRTFSVALSAAPHSFVATAVNTCQWYGHPLKTTVVSVAPPSRAHSPPLLSSSPAMPPIEQWHW